MQRLADVAAVGQSQSAMWQPTGRRVGTDRPVPTARGSNAGRYRPPGRSVALPPRALGFRAYRPARVGSRVGTDRRGSVPTPVGTSLTMKTDQQNPIPLPFIFLYFHIHFCITNKYENRTGNGKRYIPSVFTGFVFSRNDYALIPYL